MANNTLYLKLTDGAAVGLIGLPGWERERVSDALVLLMIEPRPKPFVEELHDVRGEALRLYIGERKAQYAVYKDQDDDVGIVVFSVF